MPSRGEPRPGSKTARYTSLALFLLAASCTSQPPDTRAADEATIRDLDTQWSKAAMARDLDGAVSYYTDDASLMSPNAPVATGKAAIRAAWAPLVAPGVTTSWKTINVEVARSSDLAYATGAYDVVSTDAHGKSSTEHGKSVEVWKKQADGKWKSVVDIFNSDDPVPAPSAPTPKKGKKITRSKKSRK
jgi:uncharacterized protein (TIGR02246 family)